MNEISPRLANLRKLGCRPAEIRPGQPMLSVVRGFLARQAPPRLIRASIDPAPLMLGNDVLGDCTSAGIGNHARATAALNRFQVGVTTAQAEAFYSLSTGYVPGDPRTDNGGIEVDVLTTAQRSGYAVTNQTLFPIWGSADPGDENGLRNIMAELSAVYLGVRLAKADMWQDETGALPPVWDTDTPAGHGDPTPGSAGGHCLLGWDYTGTDDTDLVTLLTWGAKQRATWRWLRSRIMEAHGLAWRQLMPATGNVWEALIAANDAYLRGAA
ncbi:hypothetical protein NO263_00390 [Gluconacetobacter entanii]|uniref:Uncharacterized protein n=1 Tax=Gluconacetobacter entanii TaxID=108528 RepID=A0ABT3K0Y8_9PROT|nr:hypothetical protein [Gluconacetobacter entanii]MCW4589063.1 hypothetical protein [Gluconacetobacter entanii]MCW4592461.1 hypothetical protein [Gluconacetobacter entanii]NPC89874.1 hypothetical protein [Gluconacetobacter entanii]